MEIQYTPEQITLKPRLEPANINPASFLATDYLNHYNEIVMLLEMVPDMPDLAEDCYDWGPKTYPQHFLETNFAHKDLAIEAFEIAPDSIRDAMQHLSRELDQTILTTIVALKKVGATERGLSPPAQKLIRARVAHLQELLLKLNQVIHGKLSQEITKTGAAPVTLKDDKEAAQTQEEIDKLFD